MSFCKYTARHDVAAKKNKFILFSLYIIISIYFSIIIRMGHFLLNFAIHIGMVSLTSLKLSILKSIELPR